MPPKFLVLAVAANTVVAQLLLKRALMPWGKSDALSNLGRFIALALRSPWFYAALALQCVGYILWMVLISRVKLGIGPAAVGAAFYVMMGFAAWVVYGESLTLTQWLGIGFIALGVMCFSFTPGRSF